MKEYKKHYPTLEEIQPLKDSKLSPINYLVKSKSLKAEITENPDRIGEGFAAKFHFNLSDCDDFLRNTVHEVTENKPILKKFSHDREGNRMISFSIETWLPTYIDPKSGDAMTFDDLNENPKMRNKALVETFKNLFANDLHTAVLDKLAIAKMADDHGTTPDNAAILYESQNNAASTVTNKKNDSEFNQGIASKIGSFLKSLSKEKDTGLSMG